ncbi:hypothetical protein BBJ28_00024800, partial [Nothophytophthora sp. Chile5]
LVEHIFRAAWASHATNAAEELEERRRSLDSEGSDDADELDTAPLGSAAASAARVKKIHPDAVKLSSEYLRLFVVEALHRAQMEATVDDSPTVEPHHLEQILAQLLLDF